MLPAGWILRWGGCETARRVQRSRATPSPSSFTSRQAGRDLRAGDARELDSGAVAHATLSAALLLPLPRVAKLSHPVHHAARLQVLMCLLAHQCGAWAPQQPSQQPAEKQQLLQPQAATLFGIDEQQQQDCGADTLQQQASSGSSDPGVGTPPVLAGTPQKCASNSSSMHSDESEAVAAAERQQQARLAGRLQQLMSAWDGGRSGGSSAQVSPGGGPLSNGSASPLRQQALSVPESPLSGKGDHSHCHAMALRCSTTGHGDVCCRHAARPLRLLTCAVPAPCCVLQRTPCPPCWALSSSRGRMFCGGWTLPTPAWW